MIRSRNLTQLMKIINIRTSQSAKCSTAITGETETKVIKPKQTLSKAMKAYLERAKAHDEFMAKENLEFQLGKRHLANMMGENPDTFTQEDIDNAIEYLFPSGLYDKKARPLMRSPEEIFPQRKAAEFDESGRPFHFLFYTGKPNYYKTLYEIVDYMDENYKIEDINFRKGIKPNPESKLDMHGYQWLDKTLLEQKFVETLSDRDYENFITTIERLVALPYSAKYKDFVLNYCKPMISQTKTFEITPLKQDENGRNYITVYECRRKRAIGTVTVRSPGTGKITINNQDITYFTDIQPREQVLFPLLFTDLLNKVDVEATVAGGGPSGQAGAIRWGVSWALRSFVSEDMLEKMRLDMTLKDLWKKFYLLTWKNWILQIRHPRRTIIELIIPLFFAIILVILRLLILPETHRSMNYYPYCLLNVDKICDVETQEPKDPDMINPTVDMNMSTLYLAYTPAGNPTLDRVIKILLTWNVIQKVRKFENKIELEKYYIAHNANDTFVALEFEDSLRNKLTVDGEIFLALRFPPLPRYGKHFIDGDSWYTSHVFPTFLAGPRSYRSNYGGFPEYFLEGFLSLQMAITYAIIVINKASENEIAQHVDLKYWMQKLQLPTINMHRYPNYAWYQDLLLHTLKDFFGLIILLSYIYTFISTVKMITTEKEKQLKEMMKIMGLSSWLHWSAWFAKSFFYFYISGILIIILLKIHWYHGTEYSVLTFSNIGVLLLFFFCYICASITLCFAVSVFFSKASIASLMAGVIWFLSYYPFESLRDEHTTIKFTTNLLACLSSNTAMSFGFQIILKYEANGQGMHWSNVFKRLTPDENLTLGLVMILLLLDAVIYMTIAWYVEGIFPGEFGVPLPWNFPFKLSYWLGQPVHDSGPDVEDELTYDKSEEAYEPEPRNLTPGIEIMKLRKVFNKRVAVRRLNLNMYEGQITVLLGHNGAGKSTTMMMLTGMFPPTDGTALINGYDIRKELDQARSQIGICPQHNILFDDLTVEEHLYFFGRLKGLSMKDAHAEVHYYVDILGLQDKIKSRSETLSGGMKRKLAVGIALCAKSKVVMLDEPTAGMDPTARRTLWQLLQSVKEDRTIILTTHFMDEADLLGDRIAIMAGGVLQCCGSSYFLKKRFGAGYHLIIEKTDDCNVHKITELLRQYIPNIEIHSDIGAELTYLLSDVYISNFERMLSELENKSKKLGVIYYGISLTTLEEVFMRVGADHGQEEVYAATLQSQLNIFERINDRYKKKRESCAPEEYFNTQRLSTYFVEASLLSDWKLIRNQYQAMFKKKCLIFLRNWFLEMISMFIPMILLILIVSAIKEVAKISDQPAMPLTLEKFSNSLTLITGDNDLMTTYKSTLSETNSKYINVDNITKQVMQLTKEKPSEVKLNYIVGVQTDPPIEGIPVVTAWFNNDPYHARGITLALIMKSVLKSKMGSDNNIYFKNYPLPYDEESKAKLSHDSIGMGFIVGFNLSFSMAFVSSLNVVFYIRERMSNFKHLQFVSGMNVFVFWTSAFMFDMFIYTITVVWVIIGMLIIQEEGFNKFDQIVRFFLLLLLFGYYVFPTIYWTVYLFDTPLTGFTRMTFFSVATGCVAFLTVELFKSKDLKTTYIADYLHSSLLFIPHYCMGSGIRNNYETYSTNVLCENLVRNCMKLMRNSTESQCWEYVCDTSGVTFGDACCDQKPRFFKWPSPGIALNILLPVVLGSIGFITLLMYEYQLFKCTKQRHYQLNPSTYYEDKEDYDVYAERKKVHDNQLEDLQKYHTIVMKDVTKYYQDFLAVDQLCLLVSPGECFGLLGLNGAGKTTTFRMMTGDLKMSEGDAWVNGFSVRHDIKNVQRSIGYCPQFDALLGELTMRETLIIFGMIRGVPVKHCEELTVKISQDFDFKRHIDKRVRRLSGGNRRKLSAAVALIGDPIVLYLDEPTTNMDPATRRFLWNRLCKIRDEGKCLVLTSHSMEECEALCTRLAIMVNGRFKCLGSIQHLKSRFADGYTLIIKLRKPTESHGTMHSNTDKVEEFISKNFPMAIQDEKHEELLSYYIPQTHITWSQMFGILERGKQHLNIEDYSLGQSSLEQVFLNFTKFQTVE